MMVGVGEVKIIERIRKNIEKIEELAEDIKQNGLINPITVMPLAKGGYQLLAGLRRLRACEYMGWDSIPANIVEAKDAEAALKIEFSENEQREAFTISERLDYARLIEEIERAKARKRMESGQREAYPVEHVPQGKKGKTRDIVAKKAGLGSGKNYERAKYIAKHGGTKVLEQIDNKELSIRAAYDKLKNDEQCTEVEKKDLPDVAKAQDAAKKQNESKKLLITKLTAEELSTNTVYLKMKESLRQLEIEVHLANAARNETERNCKQQMSHMKAQIIGLEKTNAELQKNLDVARERIAELEQKLKLKKR